MAEALSDDDLDKEFAFGQVIGRTEHYAPYYHSNYGDLYMALGVPGDFRLRHLATEVERPITREEILAHRYSFSVVWYPIDLENNILERLTSKL